MDFATVILAAGEGSRAGGYKPLWPLGRGLVIDRAIEAASTVCREVRVVGGSSFANLKAHIESKHPQVVLIENRFWEEGMFSSVQSGLLGIDIPAFIHPADIPGPGSVIYKCLKEAMERNARDGCVFRPTYHGRAGHPILLGIQAVRAVQKANFASNLRDELKLFRKIDTPVEDEFVLLDFDTKKEFEKIRTLLNPWE